MSIFAKKWGRAAKTPPLSPDTNAPRKIHDTMLYKLMRVNLLNTICSILS